MEEIGRRFADFLKKHVLFSSSPVKHGCHSEKKTRTKGRRRSASIDDVMPSSKYDPATVASKLPVLTTDDATILSFNESKGVAVPQYQLAEDYAIWQAAAETVRDQAAITDTFSLQCKTAEKYSAILATYADTLFKVVSGNKGRKKKAAETHWTAHVSGVVLPRMKDLWSRSRFIRADGLKLSQELLRHLAADKRIPSGGQRDSLILKMKIAHRKLHGAQDLSTDDSAPTDPPAQGGDTAWSGLFGASEFGDGGTHNFNNADPGPNVAETETKAASMDEMPPDYYGFPAPCELIPGIVLPPFYYDFQIFFIWEREGPLGNNHPYWALLEATGAPVPTVQGREAHRQATLNEARKAASKRGHQWDEFSSTTHGGDELPVLSHKERKARMAERFVELEAHESAVRALESEKADIKFLMGLETVGSTEWEKLKTNFVALAAASVALNEKQRAKESTHTPAAEGGTSAGEATQESAADATNKDGGEEESSV